MWKKILCIMTLSISILHLSNIKCFARKIDTPPPQNTQTICNSAFDKNQQEVEYDQLVVGVAAENDTSTPVKLGNQNYVVTTETTFCDENPYDESCKPPVTKTSKVSGSSPFDLTKEDRRGLYANSNTYQCEDADGNPLPGVSCEEQEILKTKRSLSNAGFFCASQVTLKYKNLTFTVTSNMFPGTMYAKQNGDLVAGFYIWDGTTNDPVYHYYTLEMLHMNATFRTTSTGEQGVYDTSLDYIPGTRVYDFFVMNIDNPRARYAGKYHLIYELTPDSGLGPSSTTGQSLVLDAHPTKDQGRNVLKRVRYQDDKWIRNFGASSIWVCGWYREDGTLAATAWGDGGYNNLDIDYDYYRMKEKVKIKISEDSTSTATFPDEMPSSNAWIGFIYDYENPNSAWYDVVQLKELNDQTEVYGGVKRGEIEIDIENGSWIWHQHRQQNEYSGVFEPPFTIDYNSYTVCMGEYHCDCEDINVLCSCEDEEAGCAPEIACPDGQESCSGQPADGETGNPDDPEGLGESKPKLNSLGFSVPSGGPGGATGKGSKDYYENHLDGTATLLN